MGFKRVLVPALLCLTCLVVMGQDDGNHKPPTGVGGPTLYAGAGTQGGQIGARAVAYDTVTVAIVAAAGIDYNFQLMDDVVSAADSVYVVGTHIDEFCWTSIDTLGGFENAFNNNFAFVGTGVGDWIMQSNTRRLTMFYFNIAKRVPREGSTILSAKLYLDSSGENWNLGVGDSISCALMDEPADNLWYDPDETARHGTQTLFSLAEWNDQDALGSEWHTTYLGDEPEPYFWGVGDIAWERWSGNNTGSALGSLSPVIIDFTPPAQAAESGATNNGFILWGSWAGTGNRFAHWQPLNPIYDDNTPVIIYTYVTRRYQPVFPGTREIALLFSTDDFVLDYNTEISDTFAANGAQYTAFIAGRGIDSTSSWDEIVEVYNDGHEIGYHAWWGGNSAPASAIGLAAYDGSGLTISGWSPGLCPPQLIGSPNGYDSTLAECDPDTVTRGVLANEGVLLGGQRWMKTLALPRHGWTPYTLHALSEVGFTGFRSGEWSQSTDQSDDRDYRALRTWAASGAEADSLRAGLIPYDRGRPRNVYGVSLTTTMDVIVGDNAATPTDEEIQSNVAVQLRRARARGHGALVIYSHDDKASVTYSLGIDPDELGVVIRAGRVHGGDWLTTQDYFRRMVGPAVPAATPAGYGQTAGEKFTANQRVWFDPSGANYR